MLRALWLFFKVVLAAAIFAWLARQPGRIDIESGVYTITMQLGHFLAGLFAAIIVLIYLQRLIELIASIPRRIRERRQHRLMGKGHDALVRSLVALASGDANTADYQARRAGRLMPAHPRLPMIFQAHTARLIGREDEAGALFSKLRADKETALLGMRGLMQAAMARNDFDQALEHAREAQRLFPRQGTILKTVYDLEIRARDWDSARKTLKQLRKRGVMSRDKCDSDLVAMLIHQADRLIEQGYRPAALEKLRAAHKVDPGFPPLAQRLAQFYIDRNKRRRAIRVLEKAWKRFPHPDLVPLWDEVAPRNKPNDSQVRLRWFERLLSLRPDSAEGQMAVARAAIDDGLWGEARAYLAQAEKIRPNPRLYRMWAELEDLATHDEDAARTWLEKAAQAPGDKAWVCTRTGRIYEQWAPIAAPHGSFNTISWDYPESWRRGDSGEDTNAIAHDELYMLT